MRCTRCLSMLSVKTVRTALAASYILQCWKDCTQTLQTHFRLMTYDQIIIYDHGYISGLPWVWWFPWGFPWVWVWMGDESPLACGNSVGIFDWLEIKRKCVKYAINVIHSRCLNFTKLSRILNLYYGTFWIFPALSLQNTLQNTDSNSISIYSENNAYLNIIPIHDKLHKVCI